jgi:hypothetical protein
VLKEGLHEFIDRLQSKLNDIGASFFQTFVNYADITAEIEDTSSSALPVGAWHKAVDDNMQIQQQQQ